ncbi:leucine-rich repeat domain-containing protein [bacterium]|nr:leucine-rich repeat domain-containing protein [bacterium]
MSSTDFLNSEHTNNIQEIDLSNNQIGSIDNSTWKCSILKKLNLSSNKISTINFKSLTSLKYLDLSHNQLSLLENKVFSSLKGLT